MVAGKTRNMTRSKQGVIKKRGVGRKADNGSLQIVIPYPGSPIADGQEVLRKHGVSLQRIDRSMMTRVYGANTIGRRL